MSKIYNLKKKNLISIPKEQIQHILFSNKLETRKL